MVSTEPLRNYLGSIEAAKAGEKEKALKLLASSIGATEPTPYMKSNLDKLTKPHEAILTLILHNSKGD